MSVNIGKPQIVNFFLDLYKLQSGVPKMTEAEVHPITAEHQEQESIYELRLKKGDRWSKRRMSVSEIGENSGGKSRCFKVVYDDLLVLKIPPKPIVDFHKYLDCIRLEKEISAQLGDNVHWVSPGISALLKRIYRFPDETKLNPIELEKRYLMWLNDNYQYIKYLKINDMFIFFMDLSRYLFLSGVISELYREDNLAEKMIQEMDRSAEILAAEAEPGIHLAPHEELIYSRMKQVFGDYQSQVRTLLRDYKNLSGVSGHDLKAWFIAYISGEPLLKPDQHYPEAFIRGLVEIMKQISAEHAAEVQDYRQMTLKAITQRQDTRRIPQIRGITTNVLNLLATLMAKNISMRDLKPDNIFVAGDSEQYPLFLSQPEDFSLGLIDFETAISIDEKHDQQLSQPLIGGTPSYATPSHFFHNEILKKQFGGLRRIYLYQDWFASLGIIHLVATNAPLFVAARKTLHKMLQMRQMFVANKIPLTEVLIHGSKQFWKTAADEFQGKLKQHERRLKSLMILMPDQAKEMLHRAVVMERRNVHEAIGMMVISQPYFDSYDKRKSLIQGQRQDIRKIRERLTQDTSGKPEVVDKRRPALNFLEDLEYLKFLSEQQRHIGNTLAQPTTELSAYHLLTYIFEIVLNAMYKPEWGKLERAGISAPPPTDLKSSPLHRKPPVAPDEEPTVIYDIKNDSPDEEVTLVCDIEND